jgi:hypothetical protein
MSFSFAYAGRHERRARWNLLSPGGNYGLSGSP